MEVPLDNKIIYIYKNIAYLDEDDIALIYDKIRESIQKKSQNKIITNDIKKVRKSTGNVKVSESNKLENKKPDGVVRLCNKQPKKNVSNKVVKPIDDDDVGDASNNDDVTDASSNDDDLLIEEKNTLILKYVNGLLKNAGKNEIDDLTEFKNIDRSDIVLEDNVKHLETMAKELFKLFDRNKCRYYPKTAKSRPLNVLRGMIKDTQTYKLVALNTDVPEIINDRHLRRSAMLYSICRNI
jgi:hypothetical protein